MSRKDLAVPVDLYDGAMTLWVMPYVSAMNNIVQRKFERIVPGGGGEQADGTVQHPDWTWLERAFVMIEGNVVDALFNRDKLPLPARMWQAYWSERNGDLVHNWDAFAGVAAQEMTDGFWLAYKQAQADQGLKGDEDLRQPEDNADPNDGSVTKKPKRTS